MSAPFTFRATWPICDTTVPAHQIAAEANEDLPRIVHETRAILLGPGSWRVQRSSEVPGCGGTTPHVLVFRAPAKRRPRRDYHRP